MTDVEYVARVVIERVERRIQPKGSPIRGSSRTVTSEDRVIRDKGEVLSFTVRDADTPGLREMVVGMLTAGLPAESVKGETTTDDEDEEMEDED